MNIYRDTKVLNDDFPFEIKEEQLKKSDNCADSFHWHNFCEITYVLEGSGKYFVNGRQYEISSGDLIIFNNTEPHGWMVESDTMQVLVMVFSLDLVSNLNSSYLKPFIERGSNFQNKISSEDLFSKNIYHMMKEIHEEYQQNAKGFQLLVVADILRILTFLIRYYQKEEKFSYKADNLMDKKKAMKRLEDAFCYINNHYTEKITLNEVANSVYMSETYFSAYFKKVANCSFIDYVTGLRLKKADELMKVTDLNMNEVALESGFHNMSNFYRMYKKHVGELPHRNYVTTKTIK
jgi:AraC-like DNA-binding protein